MKKSKIAIFIFIIVCLLSCLTENDMKKVAFKGLIAKIYQDVDNHSMYTFLIKTSDKSITGVADVFPNSWEYASVGDSIIKEKDELYIKIIRKNGEYKRFYFQK